MGSEGPGKCDDKRASAEVWCTWLSSWLGVVFDLCIAFRQLTALDPLLRESLTGTSDELDAPLWRLLRMGAKSGSQPPLRARKLEAWSESVN